MYLKRLELQGFKSFADKTILELKKGITGVIGPNGSGKSNIADAIRWVLGEQSMKELRGGKSVDVIFAGTQSRKSLGFAEVTLVFDNLDGELPIEYDEVTVTRKLFRSGETGYYINKTQCRLKDILELFMDTGIGKDGYSIIGQGKIDEILSNKSEDRRNVFEEAAGIVKFKTRKEESEKKLENTKLNVLRINDILTEIESNIEPLKLQSEKARKYLDLKSELKKIEIGLYSYNIEKFKEDLLKTNENIDIIKENLNLEEGKLEKIKNLKEELKTRIDELTQKIEETQNFGFTSQKELETLNSKIGIDITKIESNEENKKNVEKEIDYICEKIKKSEEEIVLKTSKKTNLKENKEKYEKELNEKQERLDEINKTLSEEELKIEENKKILENNIDLKYEIESKINEQNINIVNYDKRKNQIEEEKQNNISEIDNARFTKEELEKSFYDIQKDKNNLQNELKEIQEKKIKNESELKIIDDNLNSFIHELNIKKSKYQFLIETEKEKEGYAKSVKELLKECEKNAVLKQGVEGALATLIDVPKEYETAIEMALMGAAQNIVTKEEKDAKRLIEYLKKNNLGRASFLPISAVYGKKLEKIKGKNNGVFGIASDLIKYDKKYEQIVLNLLGRTVIVENMDIAIKLAKENNHSFKIVTLDGDIINVAGSITGGSVNQKNVKILGRSKEIEILAKQIEEMTKKQEEIQKSKDKITNILEEIIKKENDLKKNMQEAEIKYNIEIQKINTINEYIDKYSKGLEKIKQEEIEIENQRKESVELINNYNIQKEKIDKQNIELKNKIEEFAVLNKDKQKQIDDLNFDITNLKISVSSFNESELSINEMVNILQEEIDNQKKSIKNKKEQIEKFEVDNKTFDKEIEKFENEKKEILNKVSRIDVDIEHMKIEREQVSNRLSDKEKEEIDKIKSAEELKGKIIKLDVKKSKTDDDLNHIITLLWDEYELTPNNLGEYEKVQNVSNTSKKVNSLKQEIRELGSINVDSIEEYKNLKQRYDFLCEQRLDMEDTMAKLRDIIFSITENMKKIFKEKIEIINSNFSETFRELFGGGEAKIIIEDEKNILDCGIDIIAEPPGKKLQTMDLLSGGERAFTAIALLFAILKMNPAPFCVLDEIEAALDDINVNRYADFLKKFAYGTQFLVITHRKGTMEVADTVYGVTMEEKGISKLLSMDLKPSN